MKTKSPVRMQRHDFTENSSGFNQQLSNGIPQERQDEYSFVLD
jgi:hypothetical protein